MAIKLARAAIGRIFYIAAVAAVGRTVLSFVIALLLAVPAAGLHWFGMSAADPHWTFVSWCFAAGLYATTLAYLLRYVFQQDVMTADRLFGAAAAYLMIGVLWAYFYAIVGYGYPGSFGSSGAPVALTTYDFLYFSFTVLTSTGFGDITPLLRQARSLCVSEQLVGTLFLAILIARLAGVYPPFEPKSRASG
jgi:ion channel